MATDRTVMQAKHTSKAPASAARLMGSAGLVALALMGCQRSGDIQPEGEAAAVSTTVPEGNSGVMRVQADQESLTPPAPPGFEACHEDFEPSTTPEQHSASRAAFDANPPMPRLHAMRATALGTNDVLVVEAQPHFIRLRKPKWASVVHVAPSAVRARLIGADEWNEFYARLLNSILPAEGFVAFLGAEDWDNGSLYSDPAARFYVVKGSTGEVRRRLLEDGARVIERLACAQAEGPFHRNVWRARAMGDRVLLAANLHYHDYGGRAEIDLRVHPLGPEAAVVVACMHSGNTEKYCSENAFAAVAR